MSLVTAQGFNPYHDEIEKLWETVTQHYPHARANGLRGWWHWVRSSAIRQTCEERRVELDCKYSFAIPNKEALQRLCQLGPLIEIGAGTGYWGWLLRKMGADILLFDIEPTQFERNIWHGGEKPWTDVRRGEPNQVAKHPDRTLFMCWPPFDFPMASEALKHYRGNTLAYVGHCARGNTGDFEFHVALHNQWDLQEAITLPNWRDFTDGRPVSRIPTGASWGFVSKFYDDYRDKLFIFTRKK